MSHHPQLCAWADRVATRFPDLPRHQARALAEWSVGMVLAHACGLTAVAAVLGQAANTARQRLRGGFLDECSVSDQPDMPPLADR